MIKGCIYTSLFLIGSIRVFALVYTDCHYCNQQIVFNCGYSTQAMLGFVMVVPYLFGIECIYSNVAIKSVEGYTIRLADSAAKSQNTPQST